MTGATAMRPSNPSRLFPCTFDVADEEEKKPKQTILFQNFRGEFLHHIGSGVLALLMLIVGA
jgi:hypothetical protein